MGRLAPHLVRPLPFLIGTYGSASDRGGWCAGFAAYDAIGRPATAACRRRCVCRAAPRVGSRDARLFPRIDGGLTGGALWYDYQTRHPDRLKWTVALAAEQAGAELVNYVEAVGPLKDGSRVAGAASAIGSRGANGPRPR